MDLKRITIATCLIGSLGCHSMRPVQPAQFIPKEQPDRVLVTAGGTRQLEIDEPLVENDTLRGLTAHTQQPMAIALKDINSVRAEKFDAMKTGLFVGLPLAAVLGFWAYEVWKPGSDKAIKAPECGFDPDGQPYTYC
jgi:hypothetical protein